MTKNKALMLYSSLFIVGVAISSCGLSSSGDEENQSYASIKRSESSKIQGLLKKLKNPESDDIIVIGHRACWAGGLPENSIGAINRCIDAGVHMVELDVRQTADGELVLLHDQTLERTTNGHGDIAKKTLAELKSLRLKNRAGGDDTKLTDEQIPTLAEALKAVKGKVLVNLDLKQDIFDDAISVITQEGVEDHILMKMRVHADDPSLIDASFLGQTMFMPIIAQCVVGKPDDICSETLSEAISEFKPYDPVAIEIVFQEEAFMIEGADDIKNAGLRLWVNTLQKHHAAGHMDAMAKENPEDHWGHLISLGADMIQTDEPEALLEYLKSRDQ